MEDYYAVLGITRNATQEEIRMAYEARLREFAPSQMQAGRLGEADEELLERVHEAYAALSDPNQRMTYHARFSQQELQAAVEHDSPDILRYIQDQANIYNERAIEFFQQKRLADAITEWKRAIEITPNVAELHYNLGNAYAKQGALREAIEAWEHAVDLVPKLAEAFNNLGYAYYKLGAYREAKERWEKCLEIKPSFAQAKRNIKLLDKHPIVAEPSVATPSSQETIESLEAENDILEEPAHRNTWWARVRNTFDRRRHP